MYVTITIGPVPTRCARAWTRMAASTARLLRTHPDAGVPSNVIDIFERHAAGWARSADESSDRFVWVADIDSDDIRRVRTHWSRIMQVAHGVELSEVDRTDARMFQTAIGVGVARGIAIARRRRNAPSVTSADVVTVLAHSLMTSVRIVEASARELRDLIALDAADDVTKQLGDMATQSRHVSDVLADVVRGGASMAAESLNP